MFKPAERTIGENDEPVQPNFKAMFGRSRPSAEGYGSLGGTRDAMD